MSDQRGRSSRTPTRLGRRGQNPYIFCFDREKEGEIVWKFENESGFWSTPAVVDDRLFVGGNDGYLFCVTAKSGDEIRRYEVGEPVWSSPAVVGDKIVVGASDNHVHMVDAKEGKGIWKAKMGGNVLSTPIVVDGRIYVGASGGTFRCYA